MLSLNIVWEEFLKIIKEEAGSQVVETWFKAVCFEHWDSNQCIATLRMPNQFVQNWVKEHYHELLKRHLSRLLQAQQITLQFICSAASKQQVLPAAPLSSYKASHEENDGLLHGKRRRTANDSSPQSNLPIKRPQAQPSIINYSHQRGASINENYVFDSFVVGSSNSLAHAAAYAVSQNLGSVYNPLYIYGATGLGKTHLLHALANEVLRQNPSAAIRYETADQFMHDFINSIRFDKSHFFRDRYKKIDLLLIDDVQFFSNKEQTQEMFFHVFNTLYEHKKQIVLSSDTFPKEIVGLQERLKSRMGWGLVVDIQVPDLETKTAILKRKAEAHNMILSEEVAMYIASRVISNIRELEGSLVRVGAFASLTNQPITLDLAKRVLMHLPEEKSEGVMLNKVLKAVAKHFAISIHDLRSKKRSKNVAEVRQIAFYLMKKMSLGSLQSIGNFIGGRDHSTVIHAIGKAEELKKKEANFAQRLKMIEQEILSN